MSIKRYTASMGGGQEPDGCFVMYDDHAAEVARLNEQVQELKGRLHLVAELNDVQIALHAEVEKQVRALAAENSELINSSVCTLQDGRPPHGFYASEWFIAKLKNGKYVALKALPEEYSHDYRTNDGTYYTKDWVVGWMQTPDTEYRPNVETPTTDAILREVGAQAIEGFMAWSDSHIEEGDEHEGALREVSKACKAYAARIRKGYLP